MEKKEEAKAVCAKEALDLLNCVTQSPYDQSKCLHLLDSLRKCVVDKNVKKFTLADQDRQEEKQPLKRA